MNHVGRYQVVITTGPGSGPVKLLIENQPTECGICTHNYQHDPLHKIKVDIYSVDNYFTVFILFFGHLLLHQWHSPHWWYIHTHKKEN